jgi:hypothetical protein
MMADSSLEFSHRCVLVALSEFMDFDTLANAYPGDAVLVERTGASESTVYRARKAGELAGWIVKVSEGGFRRSGSTASTYVGIFAPENLEQKALLRARVEAMHAERMALYEKVMAGRYARVEEQDDELTEESWNAQHYPERYPAIETA